MKRSSFMKKYCALKNFSYLLVQIAKKKINKIHINNTLTNVIIVNNKL